MMRPINHFMKRPALFTLLAAFVVTVGMAGCGNATLPVPVDVPTPTPFAVKVAAIPTAPPPNPEPVRLRYAMWSPFQLPAYTACAEQFMAQNPRITIEIEQTNEADYWEKLYREMAAGSAPDVFVNHLTRLSDLAADGQLTDLEPLLQRDRIDDTIYIGRLPRLWMRAGVRYGLPKDWDTVALVYNRDLIADAGMVSATFNHVEWNPTDGGAFQTILARLTVDAAGNNALSSDFDPTNVVAYGLTMAGTDGGGAYGQTQWSGLAAANGFSFTDYMFAEYYHYDDPALSATFEWFQRLMDELGYHTPFAEIAAQNGRQLFLNGQAALIADGSWMIATYVNDAPFEVGFAPLPVGPQGRMSMLNGLADSIWAGTAHPEEAWQWVKYLGSVECQLTVGEHGIVFPALQSGVERMLAHYDAQGIDLRAYTDYLLDENESTFLFPVTEHALQVQEIMQPVIEAILRGEADPADALPAANQRVNALFMD